MVREKKTVHKVQMFVLGGRGGPWTDSLGVKAIFSSK
jgi:hypothetical protein